MSLADLLPDSEEIGLFLRENNDAIVVFEALEEHLDFGFRLRGLLELVESNRTLTLESEL